MQYTDVRKRVGPPFWRLCVCVRAASHETAHSQHAALQREGRDVGLPLADRDRATRTRGISWTAPCRSRRPSSTRSSSSARCPSSSGARLSAGAADWRRRRGRAACPDLAAAGCQLGQSRSCGSCTTRCSKCGFCEAPSSALRAGGASQSRFYPQHAA